MKVSIEDSVFSFTIRNLSDENAPILGMINDLCHLCQRQQTLAQFKAALGDTMIEDRNEMGGAASGLLSGSAHQYVTPDGDLTEVFKTQLQ